MKKIIFILVVIVVSSCNIPQYKTIEVDLPMESFVNNFLKGKPNFFNNDITIEEGNKEFIKALSDTLKTVDGKMNLFDGIPVRLKTINKTKKLGYVAQFDSWIEPNNFDYHYVSEINFDVFCVIPDSLIVTLKEDKHYILDGVYVSNLTYDKCVQMLGKRTSVWSPMVCIQKEGGIFSDDFYTKKVNLGCVFLLVDNIKTYTHRETKTIKIN